MHTMCEGPVSNTPAKAVIGNKPKTSTKFNAAKWIAQYESIGGVFELWPDKDLNWHWAVHTDCIVSDEAFEQSSRLMRTVQDYPRRATKDRAIIAHLVQRAEQAGGLPSLTFDAAQWVADMESAGYVLTLLGGEKPLLYIGRPDAGHERLFLFGLMRLGDNKTKVVEYLAARIRAVH